MLGRQVTTRLTFAVIVLLGVSVSASSQDVQYTPVTDERLRSPDADDWLMEQP